MNNMREFIQKSILNKHIVPLIGGSINLDVYLKQKFDYIYTYNGLNIVALDDSMSNKSAENPRVYSGREVWTYLTNMFHQYLDGKQHQILLTLLKSKFIFAYGRESSLLPIMQEINLKYGKILYYLPNSLRFSHDPDLPNDVNEYIMKLFIKAMAKSDIYPDWSLKENHKLHNYLKTDNYELNIDISIKENIVNYIYKIIDNHLEKVTTSKLLNQDEVIKFIQTYPGFPLKKIPSKESYLTSLIQVSYTIKDKSQNTNLITDASSVDETTDDVSDGTIYNMLFLGGIVIILMFVLSVIFICVTGNDGDGCIENFKKIFKID